MKQGDQLPTHEEQRKRVEVELAAIEASAAFVRSPVMRRLLRFIVGESEAGRGALIKSYTVAVDGLGRGEDFDAQQDSYPRVQIGRLRKALESYYHQNPSVSGLRFELRSGSYEIHFVEAGPVDTRAPRARRGSRWDLSKLLDSPCDYLACTVAALVLCALFIGLLVSGVGRRLLTPWDLTAGAVSAVVAQEFPILEVRQVVAGASDAEIAERLTFMMTDAIRRTGWVRVRSSAPVPDPGLPAAPDYQLRSRLSREGDDLILSAELVSNSSDLVVWTRNIPISPEAVDRGSEPRLMLAQLASTVAGPRGIIADRVLRDHTGAALPPGYSCLVLALESRILRHNEKYDQVRSCLERTVEARPWCAKARSLLASLYQDGIDFGAEAGAAKDRATVLRMANDAVNLNPDDGFALSVLAYLQFRNGDYVRARANAWKSYGLNPYSSEQLIRVGNALFFMGDKRGLDIVRMGLEADPNPPPWFRHAIFFDAVARGDAAAAVATAEAMPDVPGLGTSYLLIVRAITSAMLGDAKAARKHWAVVERAVPQAKGDIGYLLDRIGVSRPYAKISVDILRKAGVPVAKRR